MSSHERMERSKSDFQRYPKPCLSYKKFTVVSMKFQELQVLTMPGLGHCLQHKSNHAALYVQRPKTIFHSRNFFCRLFLNLDFFFALRNRFFFKSTAKFLVALPKEHKVPLILQFWGGGGKTQEPKDISFFEVMCDLLHLLDSFGLFWHCFNLLESFGII